MSMPLRSSRSILRIHQKIRCYRPNPYNLSNCNITTTNIRLSNCTRTFTTAAAAVPVTQAGGKIKSKGPGIKPSNVNNPKWNSAGSTFAQDLDKLTRIKNQREALYEAEPPDTTWTQSMQYCISASLGIYGLLTISYLYFRVYENRPYKPAEEVDYMPKKDLKNVHPSDRYALPSDPDTQVSLLDLPIQKSKKIKLKLENSTWAQELHHWSRICLLSRLFIHLGPYHMPVLGQECWKENANAMCSTRMPFKAELDTWLTMLQIVSNKHCQVESLHSVTAVVNYFLDEMCLDEEDNRLSPCEFESMFLILLDLLCKHNVVVGPNRLYKLIQSSHPWWETCARNEEGRATLVFLLMLERSNLSLPPKAIGSDQSEISSGSFFGLSTTNKNTGQINNKSDKNNSISSSSNRNSSSSASGWFSSIFGSSMSSSESISDESSSMISLDTSNSGTNESLTSSRNTYNTSSSSSSSNSMVLAGDIDSNKTSVATSSAKSTFFSSTISDDDFLKPDIDEEENDDIETKQWRTICRYLSQSGRLFREENNPSFFYKHWFLSSESHDILRKSALLCKKHLAAGPWMALSQAEGVNQNQKNPSVHASFREFLDNKLPTQLKRSRQTPSLAQKFDLRNLELNISYAAIYYLIYNQIIIKEFNFRGVLNGFKNAGKASCVFSVLELGYRAEELYLIQSKEYFDNEIFMSLSSFGIMGILHGVAAASAYQIMGRTLQVFVPFLAFRLFKDPFATPEHGRVLDYRDRIKEKAVF